MRKDVTACADLNQIRIKKERPVRYELFSLIVAFLFIKKSILETAIRNETKAN